MAEFFTCLNEKLTAFIEAQLDVLHRQRGGRRADANLSPKRAL